MSDAIVITDPTEAKLLRRWRRKGPTAQKDAPLQTGKRYVALLIEMTDDTPLATIEAFLENNDKVSDALALAEYTTPETIPDNTALQAQVRMRVQLRSQPEEE